MKYLTLISLTDPTSRILERALILEGRTQKIVSDIKSYYGLWVELIWLILGMFNWDMYLVIVQVVILQTHH